MRVRKRLIGFVVIIQFVLFLTHFLLYETWTFSSTGSDTHGALWIKLVLGLLSVSFVAASLLAFRYTNGALRVFYTAAAVWVGLLTFLFLAAVSSWIILGVARLAGLDVNFHRTVELLFSAAGVAGLYGVFNASWTRITRTTVRLANLPATWRGRRAALISDLASDPSSQPALVRQITPLSETFGRVMFPAVASCASPSGSDEQSLRPPQSG